MRIGLITGEYPPMQGGVGAFTRELAVAMAAQGHTIHLCTDPQAKDSTEPGVNVTCLIDKWNPNSFRQIRKWAETYQLDVLNLQYEPAAYKMSGFVNLMPSFVGNKRFITTFHDLLVPYLFPKAGPLRYQAVLYLARQSRKVIVTNPQDKIKLERDISRSNFDICDIPIGSNIPVEPPSGYDRAAWRKELKIPADALLIGYFGFMNASKGVETLLRGVADVANAHLLLIGGRTGSSDPTNAGHADQIDQIIAELGLDSRIHWTGFVESSAVSAHLLACDIVALPYNDGVSYRRGSFMAALAHGCAIITTTPNVELPELADAVMLIPPESPAALTAAIRELATNAEGRERLRMNAKRLSGQFSWESIAARTLALYQEIIG